MSKIDQSITRVQRLCGNHNLATHDEVLSFLNNRHGDLLESFDWSRKKQKIGITLQVDKSTGTVAVVNGSANVNGTGTTFVASDVGRYVKIGADSSSLYVVRTVAHSTLLTLGDLMGHALPFAGETAATANYVMFTLLYSLGTGVEQIISVSGQGPIREMPEEYLDQIDPTRDATASSPVYFARAARDQASSTDIARIEVYPRASQAQVITVAVQKGHTDLLPNQYPIVPSGPLEWFAAVDTCYKLMARTKEDKWLMLAAKYNEEAEKSLEREKTLDAHKFGLSQQVKDVHDEVPFGMTDFALTHDTGD